MNRHQNRTPCLTPISPAPAIIFTLLLIAMITAAFLVLTGCTAQSDGQDLPRISPATDSPQKFSQAAQKQLDDSSPATPNAESSDAEPNPFADATNDADNADFEEAANALYQSCVVQSEVMVSTVSAFPSLAEACGFSSSDPIEMDEALNVPEGAEIQQQTLAALADFLEDPATEYRFALWTGEADMLHMKLQDPDGEMNPVNMNLYWETVNLQDARVLAIAHPSADGSKEFGYFYLGGGFQRFIPVLGGFA